MEALSCEQNLNTHAKTLPNFALDENLLGVNFFRLLSHYVTLLQSSVGFCSTLFLHLFIGVETICLLGHSSSAVPRSSGPLQQKFEFAVSFTVIHLVILSAGLNLSEPYLP